MKKIILVHSWQGDPENWWFPWLRKGQVTFGIFGKKEIERYSSLKN